MEEGGPDGNKNQFLRNALLSFSHTLWIPSLESTAFSLGHSLLKELHRFLHGPFYHDCIAPSPRPGPAGVQAKAPLHFPIG